MKRLTKQLEDTDLYTIDDDYIVYGENGYTGEAINRLAMYENMYEKLVKTQEELSKELEILRSQGKKNSARFKELMGKKLMNGSLISIIKLQVL